MATLDEMFYREFKNTVQVRAGITNIKLSDLGIPRGVARRSIISKSKMVLIGGIKDDYYSALNNTENIFLSRPNLKRRKFGANGKFIVKNGNYVYEDVALPHGCVAILSDVKIGVPLKYTPREKFDYIDYIEKSGRVKYIYIVPKQYCYKLNQTALVFSFRPLRSYYDGLSIYTQSGLLIYMYVIPYNPTGVANKPYRVIMTRTDLQYKDFVNAIITAWEKYKVVFNRKLTQLSEPIRGVDNVGFKVFSPTLENFIRHDEHSLAESKENLEDVI